MEWKTPAVITVLKEGVFPGPDSSRLAYFGIAKRRFLKSIQRSPKYYHDLQKYKKMATESSLPITRYYPIVVNLHVDSTAGSSDGHYFHQDLWAAKKILDRDPGTHVDVGSRLDTFITHLLVFRDVIRVDGDPLRSDIEGLTCIQGNPATLDFFPDASLESVSSLHVVEHFGLGRFGDPIDPYGHTKCMANLQRVLKPGGRLYFSVPVGRERVEFNAHRVLSPHKILYEFDELDLISLDGVIDGELVDSISPEELADKDTACGLFEFSK